MSDIKLTIDGVELHAKEGETILNIARANNIYIPAICYLTRCSPTLACRLCLVDADGKRVYSCNAKAKDGMVVVTTSEEIEAERKAIMQVYDTNHPLQCGVCDKSGECELQDNTMFQKVDSLDYAIADCERKTFNDWGRTKYDAALCIVCERCITVCKDMIGDNALTTVARGSDAIPEGYKESMPKDAYTVWNKMNKSLIGKDMDKCTDCGECAAVCPTGALVFTHFQYRSNAWELTNIPSTCTHCSSGCHLVYELKHTAIDNPEQKIYRVKNDFHFQTLCAAGRFAFDFENSEAKRDKAQFDRALEAIKRADAISFTSQISNEEAMILQKIKEKVGVKLINHDANQFKKFMKHYSTVSGRSLYSAVKDDLLSSDFAIVVGTRITTDNPVVRYGVANVLNANRGGGIYFHPIGDGHINNIHRNMISISHAVAKEEAVLYWILDRFADKDKLPSETKAYLESFSITKKEMVEESVVETITKEDGTEEKVTKKVQKEVEIQSTKLFEEFGVEFTKELSDAIDKQLLKKSSFTLVAGSDLFNHPRSENLAKLLGLIEKTTSFKVLIVPEQANTIGVGLICDLDEKADGYTVGYNTRADFELTALGATNENQLDMPSMNQQEGTVVNIDRSVVPFRPALTYGGYTLSDLANALGIEVRYTVDFTAFLPEEKGFKKVSFDDLENHFGVDGSENRGYKLQLFENSVDGVVEKIGEANGYKNPVVYRANPIDQFNSFTAKATVTKDLPVLLASIQFMESNNLSEGDEVNIKTARGERKLTVRKDIHIIGDFALVPDFDGDKSLFCDTDYRFAEATITKG